MPAARSSRAASWCILALVAAVPLGWAASGLSEEETGTVGLQVRQANDGVLLVDGEEPALFYRTRSADAAEPWRVNYIHPLWSLAGAELTENAPQDHPHHRGLFWAWRRILVDGSQVADGWVGSGLRLDTRVSEARVLPDGSAEILATSRWFVPLAGRDEPVIEESAQIRLFPDMQRQRRLEVTITLRALRQGVAIGGTADEKGYGGPSIRLGHADEMDISSGGRPLVATVGPVGTGPVVNFAWRRAFPQWAQRVAVTCEIDGRPWTSWILRQELSMQNCAFPGSEPFVIPTDDGVRMRLVLTHD